MDKKYLLRILGYAALALAAVIVIVDIAFQIGGSMVQEVETADTVRIDTSEDIRAQGYIIRSESVLELQTNGYLGYTVADGERVSVGAQVADVYADTEENRSKLEAIENIDHKLDLIAEANSVKGIYTVSAADRRIAVLRQQLSDAVADGSPISRELEDELLVMLYVRDMRSGKSLDETQAALVQERNMLKASLGAPGKTLSADKLGYFYSECDGYETFFDADGVMNATIADFESVLAGEQTPELSEHTVGKIVTDYNWYLVCQLPVEQTRGMSESKRYTLHFDGENGRTLTMQLARLVYEYGNDKSVLVFQSEEMPEGFTYTRFQTVTIEQEQFSGYRVPISAVRSLDGISGVYVLRGSIVEFREISPVNVQDGVVTVDADAEATGKYKMLQYYDRIIVKGKDLYVGKIID